MKTISIETLAEKLGGNLWIKGDLKRIYLDCGYNTKKMSTKTYVYQREDGSFGVNCKIDCPSQAWQWIESQQKEIVESVEISINNILSDVESTNIQIIEEVVTENDNVPMIIPIDFVGELVGKTISWKAPSYRMNKPYNGVSKIISTDSSNKHPFKTETISGDNLDFAFVDEYARGDEKDILCYSDGGRFVTYELLEND